MTSHLQRLYLFAAALWWGSLSLLGAVVVPSLFRQLETPAVAGRMAAYLFTLQTWVSVACAVTLLLLHVKTRAREEGAADVHPPLALLGGLLLVLLLEFVIAPRILARDNLALWHALGAVCFGLQWVCAAWLLWHSPSTHDASA